MTQECVKVKFSTKKKAHFALRRINRSGKAMRAYLCPNCYYFHLTSDLKYENRKVKY